MTVEPIFTKIGNFIENNRQIFMLLNCNCAKIANFEDFKTCLGWAVFSWTQCTSGFSFSPSGLIELWCALSVIVHGGLYCRLLCQVYYLGVQDGVYVLSLEPQLIHGCTEAILTPNVVEFARLYSAVVRSFFTYNHS